MYGILDTWTLLPLGRFFIYVYKNETELSDTELPDCSRKNKKYVRDIAF